MGTLVGYRKVVFGIGLVAIGIALDKWIGLSNNLLELIKFVSIGFFIGNGVEHVTEAVKARVQGDVDGDGDADERDAQIEEISTKVTNLSNDLGQLNQRLAVSQESLGTIQQAISFIIDRAGFNKPPRA